MKIGVIGTGNIGGTLARKLSAAGHDVRVANSRGPEGVRALANEIGATAVDTRRAVKGVELIVMSIPFPAVAELPKDLFDTVPQDVPVIDTGNYYPGLRDPQIPEIDAGMPHSIWVSKQLAHPVIKAFNNILAYSLAERGRPGGSPGRLAIAVAGDDVRSKQIVMDVVNETGFDPVDAGSLDESWRQQPGTPAYCCDYDAATMRKALAAALKGEAPKKLERLIDFYRQRGSNMAHADMIAMNRSLNPLD
jgi:8-hydroxy-5-deazaflavin:NADPH oxidoreductase